MGESYPVSGAGVEPVRGRATEEKHGQVRSVRSFPDNLSTGAHLRLRTYLDVSRRIFFKDTSSSYTPSTTLLILLNS